MNGPAAGGQDLLSAGRLFVAASGGRLGFCLGPDGGQAGFLRLAWLAGGSIMLTGWLIAVMLIVVLMMLPLSVHRAGQRQVMADSLKRAPPSR